MCREKQQMPDSRIIVGDVREKLAELPDAEGQEMFDY